MVHADNVATDAAGVADLFSSYFGSVYNTDTLVKIPPIDCDMVLESVEIIPMNIAGVVREMDNKVNPGPDGIPAYFIKECCGSLLVPLVKVYNSSLAMGQFPTAWKHVYVLPIHKSGDRHNVMNYRPISILSTFSKLLDCIVSRKLAEFLCLHIARQQHGFLKGRSTVTNLLLFNNFVMSSLEYHTQVDVIYIDFSKAFDTVNHHRLLDKLWNVGIRGALHKWIYSYLSNRSQSVRVLNCISNSVVISSGVPQGSHLSPMLFNIYIKR